MTNNIILLCGEGWNCEEISNIKVQKGDLKQRMEQTLMKIFQKNSPYTTQKAQVEKFQVGGTIRVTIITTTTTTTTTKQQQQ